MKLMAGLVPDRGRGLASPWLRDTLPSGLSPFSQAPDARRRKEPETANAITQADYPPSARVHTFRFGCRGESLADNLPHPTAATFSAAACLLLASRQSHAGRLQYPANATAGLLILRRL